MNTFIDLKTAVKRYLTSNVTLVNYVQGAPENQVDLDAEVDKAIVIAANNARRYAERLHDFNEWDLTGRAFLSKGSPVNLNRLVMRQNYADLQNEQEYNLVSAEFSELDWPAFELPKYFTMFTPPELPDVLMFASGRVNGKFAFYSSTGHSCVYDGTRWELVIPSSVSWFSTSDVDFPWEVPTGAHHGTENQHAWQPELEAEGLPVFVDISLNVNTIESIKVVTDVDAFVADKRYSIISAESKDTTIRITFAGPIGLDLTTDPAEYAIKVNVAEFGKIKTVRSASLKSTDGKFVPLSVVKKPKLTMEHFKQKYINSTGLDYVADKPKLIIAGGFAFLDPHADDAVVSMDGSFWMPDYVNDADTDFIMEHGFDFLLWQSVIEVNHLLQKFIPRQEGALAPPTTSRDEALSSIILLDSYKYDGTLNSDLE